MRKNIDRLKEQAERGLSLISGVLDYSVVGITDEEQSKINLEDVLAAIGTSLSVRFDQIVAESPLTAFKTRAVRLEHVLSNLVENAFKYHHDRHSAEVRVSIETVGKFYRFHIAHNGPGIDEQHHEAVFEPFRMLELAPVDGSSGIGLSIVKKSVEMLGGTVSIRCPNSGGTVFTFDWPVSDDALGQMEHNEGLDFLAHARQHGWLSDAAIYLLSSPTLLTEWERARDLGVEDCLAKPIDKHTLLNILAPPDSVDQLEYA